MKLIAINGSPNKSGNTVTLLKSAMEGAASKGFETELINLCDLKFKGCIGCLSCKVRDGKHYGSCALNDELTPIIKKIEEADSLIIGSPNYLGAPTSTTKAFIERLIYPYVVYSSNWSSLAKKKISTGFIYTMSSNESWMKEVGYDKPTEFIKGIFQLIFGACESLIANDIPIFKDYSKYVGDRFNPIEKTKIYEEKFPNYQCEAFELGVRLTKEISE